MILDKEDKIRLQESLLEGVEPEHHAQLLRQMEVCYVIHENGYELIVISPGPEVPDMTLKFELESMEFIGPEDWEYAVENGELVEWQ